MLDSTYMEMGVLNVMATLSNRYLVTRRIVIWILSVTENLPLPTISTLLVVCFVGHEVWDKIYTNNLLLDFFLQFVDTFCIFMIFDVQETNFGNKFIYLWMTCYLVINVSQEEQLNLPKIPLRHQLKTFYIVCHDLESYFRSKSSKILHLHNHHISKFQSVMLDIMIRMEHAQSAPEIPLKQECNPAGCVPAARGPYAGVSIRGGGVCLVLGVWGVCLVPGGWSARSRGEWCLAGPGGEVVCQVPGGCLPGPRGGWHPSMHWGRHPPPLWTDTHL